MMPLNVWTMLWVGDEPWRYCTRPANMPRDENETRAYTPREVVKYKAMVERHLPDCKFRCLSNVPIPGVECIPLNGGMVGWWPKMELFRPDLPSGRNLYFDLDTLIVRDAQALADFPAPFAAIEPGREVGSDKPEPWLDVEGKLRVPKYQTSVMVWDSRHVEDFWRAFQLNKADNLERLASDQDFLGEQFPSQARMPTEWFTRIKRVARMFPPPPIKVVLTMRMHNDGAAGRYPWVKKLWH
jgi:hypothetical protein